MASSPLAGRTLGHFHVLEAIGAGGMGVVYRARDERLHRDVALKVLAHDRFTDDNSRKRFRNEALALSRLNHPNIASIYEFDSEDGVDFLVMELITGQTLAQKLKDGALSESETLRITGQILEALREAHQLGIVHRDLKPSNIILTPSGRVKILDFGLSTLDRPATATGSMTTSSDGLEDTVGTLPYMAPETLQGKASDARTDIWSLGVMLYEMTAGRRPFQGKNAYELTAAIVASDAAPLPAQLTPGFRAAVARCLTKNPAQRYQTVGEVEAALGVAEGSAVYASGVAAGQGARSRPARVATVVAAMLAVVALLGFVWRRHVHADAPLPAAKQLAILPLGTAEESAELAKFGDGLNETIATRLSKLTNANNLQVIPLSEVRSKGVKTLKEANQEFGANLGLQVEVRRAGDQIRVNYQLIDAKTHRQLRGDTITAAAANPFALEDKVCNSVISSLQLELSPEDQQATKRHGTTNPEAFQQYLLGRGSFAHADVPASLDSAIANLQQAVQIDNRFALAYGTLGLAYWDKFDRQHDASFVPTATAACQAAIEADGDEPQGYICLGTVLNGTGKYAEAAEKFENAARLDPTSDDAVRGAGSAYESLNLADKAEQTYLHAISLRPHDPLNYTLLGAFYVTKGRYADALKQFQQVTAIAPDNYNAYTNVAAVQTLTGEYAAAIQTFQKSLAIKKTSEAYSNLASAYFMLRNFDAAVATNKDAIAVDGGNYTIWGNLGDALYYGGHREEAAAAYQKASELALKNLDVNPHDAVTLVSLASYQAMLNKKDSALLYTGRALESAPNDPETEFTVAQIYNQLGDRKEALRWLKKSLDGGFSPADVERTASLDNLRNDQEYQALMSPHGAGVRNAR
jgi:serine/threonine-protein kinase